MGETATQEALAARLEPLDALRGLAALGVAFFHFQHFGGDQKLYPLANVEPFTWVYTRGWLLVDFFFLLSGIVFTYKYAKPLEERKVGGHDFFVLRMSRIYPLHVATLVVCALVQWRLLWMKSPPLIYPQNDLYHFVLNLVFLHNGAFEDGYSFNGASWSVATEVFAYVVFFWATRRFAGRYVVGAVVGAAIGLSIYKAHLSFPFLNETVARALLGFFVGSLVWLGIRRARVTGRSRLLGIGSLAALAIIVVMVKRIGYDAFIGGTGFRIAAPHVIGVFPLVLVASLTVPILSRVLSIRPLTYLGDISYSVYMLHVPLQMIVLSIYRAAGANVPTDKPVSLAAFVVVLLGAAALTHRFFEVPARAWLRRRLMPIAVV